MNSDDSAKLPVPVEVSDFRFLVAPSVPGYAVLEFDTATNPVRVFLSLGQLEQLITRANVVARKLS
jgi:hypothetical protein